MHLSSDQDMGPHGMVNHGNDPVPILESTTCNPTIMTPRFLTASDKSKSMLSLSSKFHLFDRLSPYGVLLIPQISHSNSFTASVGK